MTKPLTDHRVDPTPFERGVLQHIQGAERPGREARAFVWKRGLIVLYVADLDRGEGRLIELLVRNRRVPVLTVGPDTTTKEIRGLVDRIQ